MTVTKFNQPKVYLISKPVLNNPGILEFLNDEKTEWDTDFPTDGDGLVEFAGRVCYVSFGKKQGRRKNNEYIGNLVKHGHGSVLEHANYTFLIAKASRGFTHQMVRHRAGFSFSQESTHFINYSEDLRVKKEPGIQLSASLEEYINDHHINTQFLYNKYVAELMDKGMKKKEACGRARGLLPIAMESKITVTGNLRAWRHFMEARGNSANTPEVQAVAIQVFNILKDEAPNSLLGMSINEKGDITSKYRKV